jgi:hypothetical protein
MKHWTEQNIVRAATFVFLAVATPACSRNTYDVEAVEFDASVGVEVVREVEPGETGIQLVLRTPMPIEWRASRPKYLLRITDPRDQCGTPQLTITGSSPSGERLRIAPLASDDSCGVYNDLEDGSLRYLMRFEPVEPCQLRFQVLGSSRELLATEALPIAVKECGYCWEIFGW